MKPTHPSLLLSALLAIVLLSGCETTGGVSSRIQEKSAAFAALTPEQQKLVRSGEIEIGFTSDMVYMALGPASKTEVKDSPDGPVTMLTFNKYYPTRNVMISLSRDGGMSYAGGIQGANNPVRGGSSSGTDVNTVNSRMSLEPADPTFHTLYVFLFMDKVFQIKLDES